MAAYAAQALIAADPARVWAILTDAPTLVRGGLGILRIDGEVAPGARLRLWSEVSPARAFALRVVEFDPPGRMTWEGGMPFGLFKGLRTFTLTAEADGVRFRMREEWTGLLSPLIARFVPDLTPSFEKFAAGLKRLAEEQA